MENLIVESIIFEIAKKLDLNKADEEMLLHDVNNSRGDEWLEQVKESCSEEDVSSFKKIAGIGNLKVCEHCLWAIESREGNQTTFKHYVDENDKVESMCDWCEENGFDTLYELI